MAMGFGWVWPVKLTGFLAVFAAWMGWWDKRKNDVQWYAMGFVLGPFIDLVGVYGGSWQYGAPFVLGIPVWLPFAYGLSGLLLRRLAESWISKK